MMLQTERLPSTLTWSSRQGGWLQGNSSHAPSWLEGSTPLPEFLSTGQSPGYDQQGPHDSHHQHSHTGFIQDLVFTEQITLVCILSLFVV